MQDIVQRLKAFNQNLLPDMVQLKYKAMAQSAFRFYRGTCHLFYEDLSKGNPMPASPLTWVCGDLHIENFGSYKGDNRLVYFDLNDFDESMLAPATWEISRMAASIFVAFDSLGIDETKALHMARLFLKSYADTLSKGKALYIEPRVSKGIVRTFLENVEGRKQKDILSARTEKKKGKLVLAVNDDRHFRIEKTLKQELFAHVEAWLHENSDGPHNFKVIDAAFRLAGTGSVGVKRYMFLLEGLLDKKKYQLLDMKQARRASAEKYSKVKQPEWSSQAERVISIQHRMQNVSPALLSTTTFKGESYVFQEMQPVADRIDFNVIKDRYRDIYQVIDDMAIVTASTQLRSSGRQGADIADKLIKFGSNRAWLDVILDYAHQYSKVVKADYQQFLSAYKSGEFAVPAKKELKK